jgi:nucleoside 2-deoxyribosyltransferase
MNPKDFLLTPTSEVTQTQMWGQFFRDADRNVDGYALTEEAMFRIAADPTVLPKLVPPIVEARMRGERRNVAVYERRPPELDRQYNWILSLDELLARYPNTPAEMFDRALLNVSRLIKHPSDSIELKGALEHLLYGKNKDQDFWMIRQLQKLGYIHQEDDGDMDSLPTFTIESEGWRRIGELSRGLNPSSREAFVAMSFQEDMRPFFLEGIKPAVEANGITKCVRIDAVQHNNKICDEIVAAIRRSRFVVADFTGNRGGVYFEAGFAKGLGIPVIYTVRTSVRGLHFDTRQFNHIVYKTADQLKRQLAERIAATI